MGLLTRRQACRDLVERKRIVTELDAVEPRQRGCGRLLIALDRGRLAMPGDTFVLHLDLDHIRVVLGATRDRERLRELHRRHASREFHERKTSAAIRREPRGGFAASSEGGCVSCGTGEDAGGFLDKPSIGGHASREPAKTRNGLDLGPLVFVESYQGARARGRA